MSALARFEDRQVVAHDAPADPADPAALEPSDLERAGFQLGWDHAHHDVCPPPPHAQQPSALRDGYVAGQAAFGPRTLPTTAAVHRWLQLRLHAWSHGRSVEAVQVTPHYLQQLAVSHCPITRAALDEAGAPGDAASIDRVRNDAGYAAGNLVVMSRRANHAKAALGRGDALAIAARVDAGGLGTVAGLTSAAWLRVAALCGLVEPMAHAEACRQPLLVLPPNRLRLFNPVQALQALVSRQLLQPGWSARMRRFEELLPGKTLQRDFRQFFMALLPRVLEAGTPGDTQATRWAIEDAWRSELVLQRWVAFAGQLDATRCDALVRAAGTHGLATMVIAPMSDAQATEGWNLAARGYAGGNQARRVGSAVVADRRQAELAF